ncbi:MAG: hypothetical protein ACE141_01675 [Bryobacteraceae bacterium]
MKAPSMLVVFGLLLAAAAAASGEPVIDAVMNSASYALPGMPNSGIAQGSMFVIFGKGLGPPALKIASALPLPTSLAGVSVSVTVQGTTVDCFVYYAMETQAAAILPSVTPIGSGTIKVTYLGAASQPATVNVVRSAPGVYARNQAGTGPAIVQNYTPAAPWPVNALNESAHPGGVEVLWATGLGPISGDDSTYPPVGSLPFNVEVIVGGKSAKVDYAGRSPYYAGIDQINFVVPEGVEGCYVPINLKVDGVLGNPVTMSIAASGKTCSDSSGLASPDLERALESGEARIGVINLGQVKSTMRSGATKTEASLDQGAAAFFRRTVSEMLAGLGPVQVASTPGACVVYGLRAQDDIQWVPYDPVPKQPLDAGPALFVSGPGGARDIAQVRQGLYDSVFAYSDGQVVTQPVYLVPGAYAVDNGGGGADVLAFQATTKIPAAFTWQLPTSNLISRSQNLTIQWTGADASQVVSIVGASMNVLSGVVGAFVCQERSSAGRFVVPSWVLSSLPAGDARGSAYPAGLLGVSVQPLPGSGKFSAPGLDLGYLQYTFQHVTNVTFQ